MTAHDLAPDHRTTRPEPGALDLSLFPEGTRHDAEAGLVIGGCSARELAEQYGTPALIVDEAALRGRAAAFIRAFHSRHANSRVHFACKAFPSAAVIGVLGEAGLNFDVASGNELAIALAAGVDPARVLIHGNAKADQDIAAALGRRVGYIVIDNLDDVERIRRLAPEPQPVLLRVTPGVLARTHGAIATGHAGSKFGVPMDQAQDVIDRILQEPMLRLDGLHAHIGSQIFDLAQFREAIEALAALGRFPVYDLGGGLAARYTSADPAVSIDEYAEALVQTAHRHLGEDIRLFVEPGRALVAPVAITLYTVVTVKRGLKTHVAVDGGMGDNLEVSLYGQKFQPWLLDGDGPVERCDLVGHHCESGDVLAYDVALAHAGVGSLVAVPVTGAYTYTMANNYNAAFRPPVVFCRDGDSRLAVRRETLEDLLRREILLSSERVRA
jgi:diaminopimelate decarboxylase